MSSVRVGGEIHEKAIMRRRKDFTISHVPVMMDVDAHVQPETTQDPSSQQRGNNPDIPPEPSTDSNKPSYELRFILSGHTRSISSLKFSPDGAILASSSASVFARIQD